MTVSNGREFLSIPGPTNIPDAVLQAMHRPAIDIYSGDMVELTRSLLEDLPKIFRTAGRTFIYAANGHGGWEAAVSNVLSRGETVLVLESGVFAVGWGDMAQMLGAKVEVLRGDWRSAWPPTSRTRSGRSWSCRSTPRPGWSTTSRPSAGRSTRSGTPPS
jgi:alanine-glyoxylate transaminase/serine-glyoxylate transaminase/serine-pyruvate transaminase